ncbi:hypothetical protein [Pseudofrankia sp. BMG5.36]|nr:hypothetical protein [Pseudofrankia sp. BMG5.36]
MPYLVEREQAVLDRFADPHVVERELFDLVAGRPRLQFEMDGGM